MEGRGYSFAALAQGNMDIKDISHFHDTYGRMKTLKLLLARSDSRKTLSKENDDRKCCFRIGKYMGTYKYIQL